jgi:hypothetical protein
MWRDNLFVGAMAGREVGAHNIASTFRTAHVEGMLAALSPHRDVRQGQTAFSIYSRTTETIAFELNRSTSAKSAEPLAPLHTNLALRVASNVAAGGHATKAVGALVSIVMHDRPRVLAPICDAHRQLAGREGGGIRTAAAHRPP